MEKASNVRNINDRCIFSFRSRFLLKLERKDKKQICNWSSFSQNLYSSHTLFSKINEDLKKQKYLL